MIPSVSLKDYAQFLKENSDLCEMSVEDIERFVLDNRDMYFFTVELRVFND